MGGTPRGTDADLWLPMGLRAGISSLGNVVGGELSRKPSEVESGTMMQWKVDTKFMELKDL